MSTRINPGVNTVKRTTAKILLMFLVSIYLLPLDTRAQAEIGNAKVIPGDYNNLDYFYVFGPGAKRRDGRDDGSQILFYRFRRSAVENVSIYVYDPGVGGRMDRSDDFTMSRSQTRYTVYGGAGALSDPASQSIVPAIDQPGTVLTSKEYSVEYPDEWIKLGPFRLDQGEAVGDYVYFKLEVLATAGSLGNSFRTAVAPRSAAVFSYNTTVRLNERQGSTMSFSLEVPANVHRVIEHNYDMDRGGKPFLTSDVARYKLRASGDRWRKNKVDLVPSEIPYTLQYEIIKGRQRYANAGFYFTDGYGNPLKLFFEPVTVKAVKKVKVAAPISTVFNECVSESRNLEIFKQAPEKVSFREEYQLMIYVTALTDVQDAKVNEVIPNGVSFVKSDPPASVNGNRLSWAFDRLAEGDTREIAVTLRAGAQGELKSCATYAAIPIGCVTTVIGSPELTINKTGPDNATLNEAVTYRMVVANIGNAVASNVKVIDTVPDGLTHESGKKSLVYDVGDLDPGDEQVIDIHLKVDGFGKFCNNVTASSDNAAQVESSACTKVERYEIAVRKTGPELQYLSRNAEYAIIVANPGDAPLTDVQIVDTAPVNTTIVSAKHAQIQGGQAMWRLATLEPGRQVRLSVVLTSSIAGEGCNKVSVTTADGLTAESNSCTTWKGYPALLLEVIDTNDPLQIGELTTYEIRVTNQGTAIDKDISIVARFPAEVTPVKTSGATKSQINGRTVTFNNYPVLQPHEVITFIVEAKAVEVGDSRLLVEMDSDHLKHPVKEEESTHVY